ELSRAEPVFRSRGAGELGAQAEQIVLDAREQRVDIARELFGAGDAENGVELVDGATGFDAPGVLRHAQPSEHACRSVVAGLRVEPHGPPYGTAADPHEHPRGPRARIRSAFSEPSEIEPAQIRGGRRTERPLSTGKIQTWALAHRGEELFVALQPEAEIALRAVHDLNAEAGGDRRRVAVAERAAPRDATHESDTPVERGGAELEPNLVVLGERERPHVDAVGAHVVGEAAFVELATGAPERDERAVGDPRARSAVDARSHEQLVRDEQHVFRR